MRHGIGAWRGRVAAIVVMIATVVVVIPASAQAATSLSLSLEPTAPQTGKPFDLIATGFQDLPAEQQDGLSDYGSGVWAIAPGQSSCASNANLETAKPDVIYHNSLFIYQGPFERRLTIDGFENRPYNEGSGLATGKYHACGYLYQDVNDTSSTAPVARARLDFTVGGTCETATAAEQKAATQQKKAKKKAKKAKKSGNKKKAKKAKKKLKKKKKALKSAAADREALC